MDGLSMCWEKTGIGMYTHNLLTALAKLDETTNYDVLSGIGAGSGSCSRDSFGSRVRHRRIPLPGRVYFWLQHRLPQLDMDRFMGGHDIVFCPNFLWFRTAAPQVAVVHDLYFEINPAAAPEAWGRHLRLRLPGFLRNAAAVIAVSKATRNDLVRIYGLDESKIHVIYNGVDPELLATNRDAEVPKRHILSVGTVEPRKNLERLIRAYARLPREIRAGIKLVIAGGRGWKSDHIYTLPAELGIGDRVHFTGYVDRPALKQLYDEALFLACPSLYEGFGLPIVEAMALGIPVMTSNVSSMPEISPGAALHVNPEDVQDIAGAMERLCLDGKLRTTLGSTGKDRASEMTWERAAKETLAVFNKVHAQSRS